MSALESTLERKVCHDAVVKYGVYSIKLNGRGQTGWPDRLMLVPGGLCFFIEFKAPKGRLSARQKVMHELLGELGFMVYTCDNYLKAMTLVGYHCALDSA